MRRRSSFRATRIGISGLWLGAALSSCSVTSIEDLLCPRNDPSCAVVEESPGAPGGNSSAPTLDASASGPVGGAGSSNPDLTIDGAVSSPTPDGASADGATDAEPPVDGDGSSPPGPRANCNADVCCATGCVNAAGNPQCGGVGCGDFPGGESQCCTLEIEATGILCNEEQSNAPCIQNTPPRTNCNDEVCCSTTCITGSGDLQCGEVGCGTLPGGESQCCTTAIEASGVLCQGDPANNAPCILD